MALLGQLDRPLQGKSSGGAVIDSNEYSMEHGHSVCLAC